MADFPDKNTENLKVFLPKVGLEMREWEVMVIENT